MDTIESYMTSAPSGYVGRTAVIVGVTLVAAGGVIGAGGLGISGIAVAKSVRDWLRAHRQHPAGAVIARHKPGHARAVSATGNGTSKKVMASTSAGL